MGRANRQQRINRRSKRRMAILAKALEKTAKAAAECAERMWKTIPKNGVT